MKVKLLAPFPSLGLGGDWETEQPSGVRQTWPYHLLDYPEKVPLLLLPSVCSSKEGTVVPNVW